MTQHRYLIHPLFDHTVTVDDEAPRFHEHPEDTIARAAVEEAHTRRPMISRPAKKEKAA